MPANTGLFAFEAIRYSAGGAIDVIPQLVPHVCVIPCGTLGVSELGFDVSGWTLTRATAVATDGNVIVGTGVNPQGELEAWRADVSELIAVPTPGLRDPRPIALLATLLLSTAAFALRGRVRTQAPSPTQDAR